MVGVHTENTTSSAVQIAHNVAGEFIRNGYFQRCDRLKKNWIRFHERFLECQRRCHLECHLGGVNRMIGTI